jgi:hypothetical protein
MSQSRYSGSRLTRGLHAQGCRVITAEVEAERRDSLKRAMADFGNATDADARANLKDAAEADRMQADSRVAGVPGGPMTLVAHGNVKLEGAKWK